MATTVTASPHDSLDLTNVQTANTKSEGYAPATKLSPELSEAVVAQGSTKVENPSSLASYYGYFNDVLNSAGEPQMLPTPASNTEASKSEPDKNTYLVFNRLAGTDHHYDYVGISCSRAMKAASTAPATSPGSTSTPTPPIE